jgi:glycosyltransferase involved in cell wall biosynthesis
MATAAPRALLLWHSLTGYSAAGMRALAERAEVTVLVRPPDALAPYDYDALDLGRAKLEVAPAPWSATLLDELIDRTQPKLIVSAGGGRIQMRSLQRARRRHQAVSVMVTDYNWTGRARQRVLQVLFRPRRRFVYDAAFVPGVRSTEYVRRLGFSQKNILTGVFTLDAPPFAAVASGSAARWADPRFLFVGRLVPEKAPDVLAEAYRRYRERATEPWPLQVIGRGPFDGGLSTTPGVTVSDFVQPDALPAMYAGAGALVLPSREDLWGVVALEACTAGLPVVVSDGCGAADDLATPANGFRVTTGDPASLASALTDVAGASSGQRRQWGEKSVELARPYWPEHWAETLLSIIR